MATTHLSSRHCYYMKHSLKLGKDNAVDWGDSDCAVALNNIATIKCPPLAISNPAIRALRDSKLNALS